MSSEISTRAAAANSADNAAGKDQGLQAWQFFVLAALGCATAATFITRGQGVTTVVLLSVLMAGAAFVGLTALRTIRPLVSDHDDRVEMLGRRTRAALERDKLLTLRAIKELEFDRAMGKLSEDDFKEMAGRLRTRAARLMRQLDAGAGYREQIERDLEKKMTPLAREAKDTKVVKAAGNFCTQCGVSNDSDAKFCKSCGTKL
jgi:zinc-ribbon domain